MMKRRILSVVLVLCMILSVTPIVFAESADLTINTAADLKAFADAVNGGNDYAEKTVALAADITLADAWAPIGNGTRSGSSYSGNAFKGTFDGGNHTISGLTITAGDPAAALGLFGVIDGGTVMNLKLADVVINAGGGKNAGAAIGLMVNGATAESITVSGSVIAADGVGGIVGRMTISGAIRSCTNNATVKGTSASAGAGGIVGKAYYTGEGKAMAISDCTNNGTITSGYAAGGIVGLSAADVYDCANTAAITAAVEAGGIIGEQVNRGTIAGNINSAPIANETTGGTAYGGIIGWIRYQTNTSDYPAAANQVITVSGNTNSGAISAPASSLGAGGIVGTIYNQATVTGNTNTAESIVGGVFAGGIVGGAQPASNNVILDGATISASNNVSTTALSAISANCVASDMYNNAPGAFVNKDNSDTWVAQIGDTKYATLAAAFEDADNNTIVLLESVVLTKGITIPAGKKLTLDLNGKVISGVSAEAASTAAFTNKGELTIKDSSAEKTGKITSQAENPDTEWVAGYPAYANNTILNAGKLIVESGTIENTTSGGACYAIDNNSTAANAIAIINGGVISHTTKVAIRQFANSTTYENSVTVNGGTVVGGSRAIWMQLPGSNASSQKKASLTVTDGTLTSNDETYNLAVYVYSYGDSGANVDVNISGGEFNGNVGLAGVTSTMAEKAVAVSGGTFNSDFGVFSYDGTTDEAALAAISITGGTFESNYCAPYAADEGYEFFKNAQGSYGLIEVTPEEVEDQAIVTFNVTPADAVVKVEKDGVEFGGADNAFELFGGTYTYTVSKDGYYPTTGSFTVAGEDQPVNVTLTKINYYTVTYTDGVDSAEIFADQTYTVIENSETPAFVGTVTREGYTFIGWTPAVAEKVTADVTYVATFEKLPEEIPEDNPDGESGKDPEEKPEEKPVAPVFKDVEEGKYYSDAVLWAAENNITNGVSEDEFAPDASCTRAQMVTFLWRAAGSPKVSGKMPFKDVKKGRYYYDAVLWAVKNGITNGTSADTFSPDDECTRAQVVTFLWRAEGAPATKGKMSFKDVEKGTYYTEAVLWAVKNEITNGVSKTSFAPKSDCTRAQAVTFLYRNEK